MFRIRELIREIEDGVELSFEVEDGAAKTLLKIISGKGGTFPVKVKIKIQEDVDKPENDGIIRRQRR